jgi:hypothetical protein
MEEDWRRVVDEQPVDDDYAFLVRPGEESPMRLVEEEE